MTLFVDCYRNRKILVTGHTGFKGAWLSLWLTQLGAEVTGVSLKGCDSERHAQQLQLPIREHFADIRNYEALKDIVQSAKPSLVFHLAAQSLVRRGYREPLDTWSTNLQGTANVLEACSNSGSVQACVVVTTDKVYENKNWQFGYRETDEIGGYDPYSASKAATELLVNSFRRSFGEKSGVLTATARAGNVIGGGDASEDRIIPDAIKAIRSKSTLTVRNPEATRPWQHVLEPLSGYLLLGSKLLKGQDSFADAWNFGPGTEGNQTVHKLLETFSKSWPDLEWKVAQDTALHEANFLYLNTDKARTSLGWTPVWGFEAAVAKTANWYKSLHLQNHLSTAEQLRQYIEDAKQIGAIWCQL